MNEFKVGDKVKHNAYGAGEIHYVIEYGGTGSDPEYILRVDGVDWIVGDAALTLTPIPETFKAGDQVMHASAGVCTVRYGPYTSRFGTADCYLLEMDDGKHFAGIAPHLTLAAPQAYAPGTVLIDRDGDRWKVGEDGGVSVWYGHTRQWVGPCRTVEELRQTYGPLTVEAP